MGPGIASLSGCWWVAQGYKKKKCRLSTGKKWWSLSNWSESPLPKKGSGFDDEHECIFCCCCCLAASSLNLLLMLTNIKVPHLFTNTHTIFHVHHHLSYWKKKKKRIAQLPGLKAFGMIWLAMISENGLIALIRSSWGLDCFQGWKFARWLKLSLPTGTGASAG